MKLKMKLILPCVMILAILALQSISMSKSVATTYQWQMVKSVPFEDLGPVLGALEHNGTHLLAVDLITGNMMVIDSNLTTVLENNTITYPVNDTTVLNPFIFGFTIAKGYIFGANWENQTIYLMDKNNFTIIEEYPHQELIIDLCYDEVADIFVVPFFSRQTIVVYNGTYFNGSLSSLEIGSFDSPAFIGAFFYPSYTPPTFISTFDSNYLVFEYRNGLWTQFTIDFELENLDFITDEWVTIGFQSYGWNINDVAIVNKTFMYFSCPESTRVWLFKGEEIITITTTTTTTTSNSDFETSTTTTTNPLYSSDLQTGPLFWGLLILTGAVYIHRKKKRKFRP